MRSMPLAAPCGWAPSTRTPDATKCYLGMRCRPLCRWRALGALCPFAPGRG